MRSAFPSNKYDCSIKPMVISDRYEKLLEPSVANRMPHSVGQTQIMCYTDASSSPHPEILPISVECISVTVLRFSPLYENNRHFTHNFVIGGDKFTPCVGPVIQSRTGLKVFKIPIAG